VDQLTEEDRNDHRDAYSDSSADLPLLDFGRNWRAGASLAEHRPPSASATSGRSWHRRRPYSGKIGDMLSVVRQMLGLYPERPSL